MLEELKVPRSRASYTHLNPLSSLLHEMGRMEWISRRPRDSKIYLQIGVGKFIAFCQIKLKRERWFFFFLNWSGKNGLKKCQEKRNIISTRKGEGKENRAVDDICSPISTEMEISLTRSGSCDVTACIGGQQIHT